jgi:hypothetical protein
MGIGDLFTKKLLGPTGGLASLVGLGDKEEELMAKIPLVGSLTGSKTKAQKELLKRQQEMAKDMKKRAGMNERARMNAMAQKLMAFGPQQQMMAQMFGPDAAFSPDQMAQMAQNPYGPHKGTWGQGTDQERQDQILDSQAEARRQEMLRSMPAPGPGPAPIRQQAPQAARRY